VWFATDTFAHRALIHAVWILKTTLNPTAMPALWFGPTVLLDEPEQLRR
jgi:hypothetical protein